MATVLLLLGATSVFAELKGSLDELWGIDETRRSAFRVLLRTRLLSFGLVLVLAFLLLVSLVVSAALAMLERYADGVFGSSAAVLATISSLMSFGVIACLFAVIYKTLPDAPLSWRDVWIGAACHGWPVQCGKICDRFVSGQQRCGIELWRRRIGDRVAVVGVLLIADFLSGGGVHAALCAVVRQPAARAAARRAAGFTGLEQYYGGPTRWQQSQPLNRTLRTAVPLPRDLIRLRRCPQSNYPRPGTAWR